MTDLIQMDFGSFQLHRAGHKVYDASESLWLIDDIWLAEGTGMIGGMPKTGKTWLAIDMAVSVASGTPFLGRFPAQQGAVVLYSPEGPDRELVERIRQVAAWRGLDHRDLPIFTVDAKELFLNSPLDQENIIAMVEKVQPALSIFDPLVECFSGDENRTDDVNLMTRFLVRLAKQYGHSTVVTHHMVKSGDSMRGAGALLGFGDSYLFLEKTKTGEIIMKVLQRHRKSISPSVLELTTVGENTCYLIDAAASLEDAPKEKLEDQILAFLKTQTEPLTQTAIREQMGGSYQKYPAALRILMQSEKVDLIAKKYRIHVEQKEQSEDGDKKGKKKTRAVSAPPKGKARTARKPKKEKL